MGYHPPPPPPGWKHSSLPVFTAPPDQRGFTERYVVHLGYGLLFSVGLFLLALANLIIDR